MHKVDPIYLQHQMTRWMAPNAHLFMRPDWRRFVRPEELKSHSFAVYEQKYRPDQPRVPAGVREGGRWIFAGGRQATSKRSSSQTIELSASGKKTGNGHHFVPRAVVRNLKVSEEAAKVLDRAKTGPLLEVRSNKWDGEHRIYNQAVERELKNFLEERGIVPQKMTGDQAQDFLREVLDSKNPTIKNFNLGIQIREIAQKLLRRGGRE